MLELDQLIAQPEFGLDLAAGSISEGRTIAGAHVIEVANPVQWLPEDWVVLTNGLRLQGKPSEQRKLIRELTAGDMTALGFGAGIVFNEIPPALLDEAQRCDFPVLEVPYDTSFRDIIRFVESSLHSDDVHVLRRTISMQRWLMGALSAPSPEEEMVRRLSSLLDGTVMLFHPDGELVCDASDGSTPPREVVWRTMSEVFSKNANRTAHGDPTYGSVTSTRRFDVDALSFIATPAMIRDEVRYWLVAGSTEDRKNPKIVSQAMESASSVLQGIAEINSATTRRRRSVRLQLLHDLITGEPSGSTELADRAAAFGLDFSAPVQLRILEPVDLGTSDTQRWLERVDRRIGQVLMANNVPHLVGRRDGRVLVLLQTSDKLDDAEELAVELVDEGSPANCGLSGPMATVADGPRAFTEAQLALRHARLYSGATTEPRWVRFEDLDLADWLLGQADVDKIVAKASETINLLPTQPELRQTLATFFALDLDVTKTARQLNLHPNSLRYRLGRIESLLNKNLHRPADVASLYLALTGSHLESNEPSSIQASID